jgi:two-component system, OmpR family, response regulator
VACSLRLATVVANRILVVDDEKSILFALDRYFVQHGFVVDTASDPAEAEALIAKNTYDLAIIDIHLTRRTDFVEGLELAAFLRDLAPATAVILMSALGGPETERRAAEVGAQSFVRKPARLAHVADIAFSLIGAPVALA